LLLPRHLPANVGPSPVHLDSDAFFGASASDIASLDDDLVVAIDEIHHGGKPSFGIDLNGLAPPSSPSAD
jgi:hypothetical protein